MSKYVNNRLPELWRTCAATFISDKDSVFVHNYFSDVKRVADGAGDEQLKAYAEYFTRCWRIIFSQRYENHFAPGDYQSVVNIFADAERWALKNGYADIAASCVHFTGEVYYRASRYGLSFEHLLKANESFQKIGYANVPNAAAYLYNLGLHFYQFEEFDKALAALLEATRYPFFKPRIELNTLNAIALIYAKKKNTRQSVAFFNRTIERATLYGDAAWVGIATGNLGNTFLVARRYDSAFYYHKKNFRLNAYSVNGAPEDAAKSALVIARIFLWYHKPDSARFYLQAGAKLATESITDSTDMLDFAVRLLKVKVDYQKELGNLQGAMALMDSLSIREQALRAKLDGKLLSRAVEKTEALSYTTRLNFLKSKQELADLRSNFSFAALLMLVVVMALIFRLKWLRRKRQIEMAEKDKQILTVEKLRAEEGLRHAQELLQAYVDTIKEKTILINHLESELILLKRMSQESPELGSIATSREKLVASTILTDTEWQQFRALFEQVYPGFSFRLRENYPDLTPAEARLLYLTKLSMSSREMAAMLGVSVQTIHKLRYRLRKKLHLEEAASVDDLLLRI